MVRPEQEDEQRLRAALRQRGGVCLRGHDPFDGEAPGPCSSISKQFRKVNSRNFICEILHTPMRRGGDLGSSPPEYLRQRAQVEQREHVEGGQPLAER